MKELILEPEDLQSLIDDFKEKNDAVSEIKYELDTIAQLRCFDKYNECITAFNELIGSFTEYADKDRESVQAIKAKWFGMDKEIGIKTIGQASWDMAKEFMNH